MLKQIADKLPIRWDDEADRRRRPKIRQRQARPDRRSIPIRSIPSRYVVLNSSFTFRDYAYLNNARQVPMLPDWAVVDLTTPPNAIWPGKIADADFFDEQWRLKVSPERAARK